MWCSSPEGPYFGRPQALRRATSKSDRSGNWQSDANLFHKPRFILGQEWQHAKMASQTQIHLTSSYMDFLGRIFVQLLSGPIFDLLMTIRTQLPIADSVHVNG